MDNDAITYTQGSALTYSMLIFHFPKSRQDMTFHRWTFTHIYYILLKLDPLMRLRYAQRHLVPGRKMTSIGFSFPFIVASSPVLGQYAF